MIHKLKSSEYEKVRPLLKEMDIVSTRLGTRESGYGVIYDPIKDSFMIGLDQFFEDFKIWAKRLQEHMISSGKLIHKNLVSGSSQIYIFKSEK